MYKKPLKEFAIEIIYSIYLLKSHLYKDEEDEYEKALFKAIKMIQAYKDE